MKSLVLLIFAAILFATSPVDTDAQVLTLVQPEEVGLSSERLKRLTHNLHGYVEEGRLAGGVAVVARRGKIAYLEVFGQMDMESGLSMRPDAIFRVASQTKAVVSVGIMILQEEGRLVLSDPVGNFLPEFLETTVAVPGEESREYEIVPAQRPITIRDLLTHMAGIGYGSGIARDRWEKAGITGWYFANRDEPIRVTVSRMAALPFDGQPGERWIYGYAYDILGALIEEASGQTLDDFLQSRIFEPLGMTDTHFYLPESKKDRLVVVYSATETGGLERAPDPGHGVGQGTYVDGPRKSFSGGAGLVSTANDYTRFYQMLLNGGELDGQRILSPKTVELMTVDHVQEDRNGLGFGLGFYVVKDIGARGVPGSVGEFGWGGAYNTMGWVDPEEELVVVYLTQLLPSRGLGDLQKLRSLVYQAIVQ